MYLSKKAATVLVGDLQVKLARFYEINDCSTHLRVRPQYVTLPEQNEASYLFGVRFFNERLELLFEEGPWIENTFLTGRHCCGPYTRNVRECRPADKASSRVLQELFRDRAYTDGVKGYLSTRVPLTWPW